MKPGNNARGGGKDWTSSKETEADPYFFISSLYDPGDKPP